MFFIHIDTKEFSTHGFLLTRAAISFHNLFTVHPGTAVTRQLVFRIPYMEVVQSAKKARKYETRTRDQRQVVR